MPISAPFENIPLKVLVVEDDALIAQDISNLLSDWGYSIAGASASAAEAVDIFRKSIPDLALVDIQLLGTSDGIDAVNQFNSIRRIPIIYLTAQADAPTVLRAKSTAPAAYLLKPFDERHLQISLDLAFSNFCKPVQTPTEPTKTAVLANEIKLGAELILRKENEVFIKQNYRFVKFCLSEIIYFEADRNHTDICTKDKKLTVRIPLATVLERLAEPRIVRVHRSFAINTCLVESFDEKEIVVKGKTLPFSASYRAEFYKNFKVI